MEGQKIKPFTYHCRWCNKPCHYIWDKWQHLTKQDQEECPHPYPFEEEL